MRSYDRLIKTMESSRQFQVENVVKVVEDHHAQQDLDASALRTDLWELRSAIGQLIEKPPISTVH